MSVEQNKAAVRRLNEVVNKGEWALLPEFFAPDFVTHFPNQEYKGPDGMKQMMAGIKAAFPDYTEKIERLVGEGDVVAVFYTLSGTFAGEYGGMKPTGKKFAMPACILARFENGKQVESWGYFDQLSWSKQMGIPVA